MSRVTQRIDLSALRVTNRIAWRALGGWALTAGAPATRAPPRRVVYRFDGVALGRADGNAQPLLSLALRSGPGGWSDTTYVDAELRVARNSRGDLLVLRRAGA